MSRNILIIEDDEAIAQLQRDYLENDGFSVSVERDGMSGMMSALDEDFDLVILDLMLPSLDGFEVCRRIRDEKNIPIIMCSAKKEDFDKIQGLGFGADDYITKPFSPGELVARVKAHLARYERLTTDGAVNEKDNIISVRGLKVDVHEHKAWVNKKEIALTSKESELLVYFMEHPNITFSKDDLFRTIWGEDYPSEDTSIVAVYIKKLRAKIEADTSNPSYIETVWGVGYRFRV